MFTLEMMTLDILSATTQMTAVESLSIEFDNNKVLTTFITQQLVETTLTVGQIWPRSQ